MTDVRVISKMTVFTGVCLLCPSINERIFETLLAVSSRPLREYVRDPLHRYVVLGKILRQSIKE